MSGGRLFSFRQGDRSEYLAQYLLSGLGLVTPVPRQEDIGFDFVCSIADEEVGLLTFNHQYIVSVKSLSSPSIKLEPPEMKGKKGEAEEGQDDVKSVQKRSDITGDFIQPHLDWLFRLDLPLLLAVIDKQKSKMSIYSTLSAWLLYFMGEKQECGALHLNPRISETDTRDVGYPTRGKELENGKFVFDVDLGQPIACVTSETLKDKDALSKTKICLRKEIYESERTIRHCKMGIPYYLWLAVSSCSPGKYAYIFDKPEPEKMHIVYGSIIPTLVCLSKFYETTGDMELFESTSCILRKVPSSLISESVREQLPKVFSKPSDVPASLPNDAAPE